MGARSIKAVPLLPLPEFPREHAEGEARGRRLEEAYIHEGTLDRDAFVRHSERLSEERALVRLGRHDAELEGLDVEALVNYAEYLALNPARLSQEAGPEQKARLQASWFQQGSLGMASELEPS